MTRKLTANTADVDLTVGPLRDYQTEAVASLWTALHEKDVPVSLVLPTGGGKTRVANELIVRWMVKYGS